MITIRPETPADFPAIRQILLDAFPTPAESMLVEKLREDDLAEIALVAELDGRVAGHIVFSPVRADGQWGRTGGVGLGPVAVDIRSQGQGVGSALIEQGIARARDRGFSFVVVLGEPNYYSRFGFRPASEHSLRNEYGVDAEFMLIPLKGEESLPGAALASYSPHFRSTVGSV